MKTTINKIKELINPIKKSKAKKKEIKVVGRVMSAKERVLANRNK